jgi:hypothetical protein
MARSSSFASPSRETSDHSPNGKPYSRWLLTIAVAAVSGCASQARLTVQSQPEGAYITERVTGRAYGAAPIIVAYNKQDLIRHRGPDGCYLVNGFDARWVSGVAASLEVLRLCGGATAGYSIAFTRDPAQPGFDKDMQFALQLQSVRAQQQQAQASQDAAAAALIAAYQNEQPETVQCKSTQVGNTIETKCR